MIRRTTASWLGAALTVLSLLTLAAPAAQARVPASFFGANWDADIAANASPAAQDREWKRMAVTGIRTTRAQIQWVHVEPEPGKYDFSTSDRLVENASRHNVELLPVVMNAPPWARERPGNFASPPARPDEYGRFLKVLIARYGRDGSFWTEHSTIPRRPLRYWQIWNEPHLAFQWDETPGDDWAHDYGELLGVAYKAVHEAEPGARVVLAGLANRSYVYLSTLYRRGQIKGSYDIAALHPYTAEPRGVVELSRRFRGVMQRNGDARRRLWITELGLPASEGRIRSDSTLQTTDRGMARFLKGAYEAVAAARRSPAKQVDRVYWYTWASTYCCEQFRYSGLLKYDGRDGVKGMPALRTMRQVIARLGPRRSARARDGQ